MIQGVDIFTVVFGVARHNMANHKRPPVITDRDLRCALEYHRNLTYSLIQDVTYLPKKNDDLMEKNWQLTKKTI
jgi:hypothetical protein